MRKLFRKQILLLTVLAVFFGCTANGGSKDIVKGLIDVATKSGVAPDKAGASTVDIAAADPDGLEIPAPLKGVKVQILTRRGYAVSYNADTKLPNWVAWRLDASRLEGGVKRPRKAFHEDEDVAEPRATDWDYYSSGYDRGHMCPAGDNKWSYKAQKEAFLMTNICPQNGDLNQRDWKYLEEACRDWASKYGKIYIVSGPVFRSKNSQTVGEHEVSVPDAFFKVVLTLGKKQDAPKSIGFIYNNVEGRHKMEYYARSVDEVEKMTGLNFFSHLDDKVENRIEAECDLGSW